MQIFNSVFELTGNTPLLRAQNFSKSNNLKTALLAKLEYFNPAGSVKDRVARAMLLQAERDGRLKKGSVIIEPTSGNTGIALAAMGAARGYRVIVVMPDTMSIERRRLTAAYGAEIICCGAVHKSRQPVRAFFYHRSRNLERYARQNRYFCSGSGYGRYYYGRGQIL